MDWSKIQEAYDAASFGSLEPDLVITNITGMTWWYKHVNGSRYAPGTEATAEPNDDFDEFIQWVDDVKQHDKWQKGSMRRFVESRGQVPGVGRFHRGRIQRLGNGRTSRRRA